MLKKTIAIIGLFILIFSADCLSQDAAKEKIPFENYGVGVWMDGLFNVSGGSTNNIGGTLSYAIQTNIHIGVQLGLFFDSGDNNRKSGFTMKFVPYFKYFFPAVRYFKPFLLGGLSVSPQSEQYKDQYGQDQTRTVTKTNIFAGGGAEWFPYSSVGVFAGFKALNYGLDPSNLVIGLGQSFIGIEWFM